jgi:signal transduction histidine kinase
MAMRPRTWVLGTAAAAAVATALIAAAPALRFAYRAPDFEISLETTAALVALLAAFLVFGRFRRSGFLDDLLLFQALATFAFTNLVFSVFPAVTTNGERPEFWSWSALAGRSLGVLLFAAAAFAPRRAVSPRRLVRAILASVPLALLALIALVLGLLEGRLPQVVEAPIPPDAAVPHLEGHATVLTAQVVAMALFFASAGALARTAGRSGDPFLRWLALAAVLAGFAQLNYVLYPSLYTEWVYVGDAFRLGFYAVVLAASAAEITSYWRRVAGAAVLEERRRIARDLHDGAAQELAFLAIRGRRLAKKIPDAELEQMASAAERGLDESRRAIAALTGPLDEPLDVVLAQAAREVSARSGAHVDLRLDEGVDVTAEEREALVQIASEAITNAARHAQAQSIRLELAGERPVCLRVVDDGCGFLLDGDTDPGRRGFGLVSMRQRASRIGAELDVRSVPDVGTRIEVTLP